MPRVIDEKQATTLRNTDNFLIDSATDGTQKVPFNLLKQKINEGAGSNLTVDSVISDTSSNPVQNKVIAAELNQTLNAAKLYTDDLLSTKMDKGTLATVAISGSYNDLEDKPEIPENKTNLSDFVNDVGFITIDNVPEMPTKISDLENDAEYITSGDIPAIPSKISDLENDSNFITTEDIPAQLTEQDISDMGFIKNGVGGYAKPEGGIPKTDLAEDVQESLAKADTAIQSETQPDWDATAGAAAILNKPTKLSDFDNDSGFLNEDGVRALEGLGSGSSITKISELENDTGFITVDDLPAPIEIPTKVSELENDAEYITIEDIPTKFSELENDTNFLTEEEIDAKLIAANDKIKLPIICEQSIAFEEQLNLNKFSYTLQNCKKDELVILILATRSMPITPEGYEYCYGYEDTTQGVTQYTNIYTYKCQDDLDNLDIEVNFEQASARVYANIYVVSNAELLYNTPYYNQTIPSANTSSFTVQKRNATDNVLWIYSNLWAYSSGANLYSITPNRIPFLQSSKTQEPIRLLSALDIADSMDVYTISRSIAAGTVDGILIGLLIRPIEEEKEKIPTKLSELENDSNFITSDSIESINGVKMIPIINNTWIYLNDICTDGDNSCSLYSNFFASLVGGSSETYTAAIEYDFNDTHKSSKLPIYNSMLMYSVPNGSTNVKINIGDEKYDAGGYLLYATNENGIKALSIFYRLSLLNRNAQSALDRSLNNDYLLSTRAYQVNDLFIYNSNLYRVYKAAVGSEIIGSVSKYATQTSLREEIQKIWAAING